MFEKYSIIVLIVKSLQRKKKLFAGRKFVLNLLNVSLSHYDFQYSMIFSIFYVLEGCYYQRSLLKSTAVHVLMLECLVVEFILPVIHCK